MKELVSIEKLKRVVKAVCVISSVDVDKRGKYSNESRFIPVRKVKKYYVDQYYIVLDDLEEIDLIPIFKRDNWIVEHSGYNVIEYRYRCCKEYRFGITVRDIYQSLHKLQDNYYAADRWPLEIMTCGFQLTDKKHPWSEPAAVSLLIE